MDLKMLRTFADLIYSRSGITLGENKEALMSARIRKRMRALGIKEFQHYYDTVKDDENEIVELLNAISTNVTHFFRENHHFILLSRLLKEWSSQGQTRFRLWSAASSSGEEPYSIAITMKEALPDTFDAKLLATDLSTKVLAKAKDGVYEARSMETVPRPLQNKYFLSNRDGTYKVNDALKSIITFGRLNLAKPPFPLRGPLDIIFCRNVMIYFDNEVRRGLLNEAYRLLKPGGYLMVGHAESLSGMLSDFKSAEPSVYIK